MTTPADALADLADAITDDDADAIAAALETLNPLIQ